MLFALLCAAPLAAQTPQSLPFNHYLDALKTREGDTRAIDFARNCIGAAYPRAKHIYLYTEGAKWIPTQNMPETFAGYSLGDANTAEIWLVNGTPRAVYLWEVDLEYERDSLFCLAPNGDDVTHALSRFFPAESGLPREHWVYVHSVKPGPHTNVWISTDYYEDGHGKRIERPSLTAEDKDFIAGERPYKYWDDFDFAQQIAPDKTLPKADTVSSRREPQSGAVEGPASSSTSENSERKPSK